MTIRDGDMGCVEFDIEEYNNKVADEAALEGWEKVSAFEVQTCSVENGIQSFPTLAAAIEHARKDPSVWKLSFSLPTGECVRMVLQAAETGVEWVYEPIDSNPHYEPLSRG